MDAKGIDDLAKSVAKAPDKRISLQDLENQIAAVFYTSGNVLCPPNGQVSPDYIYEAVRDEAKLMTICLIVCRNGFRVIGQSTPLNEANYNEELGRKLAYDQAIKQLWPLMGFAKKTREHEGW